jgi:hypothetical protein
MSVTYYPVSNSHTSVGGHSVSNFAVTWVRVKTPTKKETLTTVYRRLFADPKRLEEIAEANTRQLTGQPSF